MDTSLKQDSFMTALQPAYPRLVAYIRAMTSNKEDARDILSETILGAYESFDAVQSQDSFVFYLFAVARRIHWKWRWRKNFFLPLEVRHEKLAFQGVAPDELVDVGQMRTALHHLPPKQREAIILFEFTGFSIEEIRIIQGGTLSGVKARLARGRRKLAKHLTDPSALNRNLTQPEFAETQEMEA